MNSEQTEKKIPNKYDLIREKVKAENQAKQETNDLFDRTFNQLNNQLRRNKDENTDSSRN